MFVKPAPGRLVRFPGTNMRLPEAGATVPTDVYWNRRLRDGDVVLAKEPPSPKADKLSNAKDALVTGTAAD